MKKQKVSVSLDEDLLATIDLKRGNVKRSTFLNDLIKRGLTVHKKMESLPSQFSMEKKKEA
jgi:metal-responsive CopG/Arc/MetJ family transcriptional regulator